MKKRLKKLSISSDHFQQQFIAAMEERTISINIHWSKGGPLKFHKISWKIPGGQPTSVIATTLTKTSGNASFPIGSFPAMTPLTISCSFEPFSDISRALIVIIQDNPNIELKREPVVNFKNLTNGEYWEPIIQLDTQ